MKTFTKIAVMAILCGVVIFFPNNFAKASQIKQKPAYYAVIPAAAEDEMDPEIFAAINKAAQEYIAKTPKQLPMLTLLEYEGINYILSDDYADDSKIYIFPSLKLNPKTAVVNSPFILNENGIYLFERGNLIHIKNSFKQGFSLMAKYDNGRIFKDKKRVYQYFNMTNGSIANDLFVLDLKLTGSFKAQKNQSDTADYYTDKKHVYFINQDNELDIVVGADPKTFQKMSSYYYAPPYYKDKKYVYYHTYNDGFKKVKKADVKTAKTIEIFVGRDVLMDKKHLFAYGDAEITGLDLSEISTITVNSSQLGLQLQTEIEFLINAFLDKKHGKVYSVDLTNKKAIEIPGADPLSFETVIVPSNNAKSPDYIYFRDESFPYVVADSALVVTVPGADRETFEPVCGSLYKDKNNVYYSRSNDTVILNKADPASFKVLEKDTCFYAVDKNHVFYKKYSFDLKEDEYVVRDDLDASTFQYVKRDNFFPYTYDKNGVYFDEEIVSGLNPKTFKERIESSNTYSPLLYLYDENSVWSVWEHSSTLKKIEGADPKTFDFLNPPEGIF